MEPQYSANDLVFKEFVKTLALGTITEFKYAPSADEIKRLVAKNRKTAAKKLPDPADIIEALSGNTAGGGGKAKANVPKDINACRKL